MRAKPKYVECIQKPAWHRPWTGMSFELWEALSFVVTKTQELTIGFVVAVRGGAHKQQSRQHHKFYYPFSHFQLFLFQNPSRIDHIKTLTVQSSLLTSFVSSLTSVFLFGPSMVNLREVDFSWRQPEAPPHITQIIATVRFRSQVTKTSIPWKRRILNLGSPRP